MGIAVINGRLLKVIVCVGFWAWCIVGAAQATSDATPAHGELAAAVRSAGLPCAHVTGVEALAEGRWSVQCNAGTYVVTRTKDGGLAVAKP
jgi:hypothetical protein